MAQLTVLDEGSPNAFRARAYENAVEAIASCRGDLMALSEKELTAIDGIGVSTAKKIREFFQTGTITKLEELRRKYPPDFVELGKIPGLGPKTLLRLRSELGVRNLEDLRAALEGKKGRELRGLGEKGEEKLLAATAVGGGLPVLHGVQGPQHQAPAACPREGLAPERVRAERRADGRDDRPRVRGGDLLGPGPSLDPAAHEGGPRRDRAGREGRAPSRRPPGRRPRRPARPHGPLGRRQELPRRRRGERRPEGLPVPGHHRSPGEPRAEQGQPGGARGPEVAPPPPPHSLPPDHPPPLSPP